MRNPRLKWKSYGGIFVDDSCKDLLCVKLIGFLSLEELRRYCALITRYISNNHINGLLIDHRDQKVLSKDIQDYLATEWLPDLEKAGLRKIGGLNPVDIFANVSLNNIFRTTPVKVLTIKMFFNEKDCWTWLTNKFDEKEFKLK
jgi:hypothetical protein